jgi:N-acetylmuramoyl-L-alanine amidase
VKKYKNIMIIIFLMLTLSFIRVNSYVEELPLLGRIIYIDPGHGGADPGALYKDIYEKDINLEISNALSNLLTSKGAIVYMTREDDYDLAKPNIAERKRSDLSKRIRLINDSECDLYLSIHLNATTSKTWRGAQVFYDDVNAQNKILGQYIEESFKKNLGTKRKLKRVSDLYMYRVIDRVGVLLEVGFISNDNERYILKKKYYQEKISRAIATGVINYFNQ